MLPMRYRKRTFYSQWDVQVMNLGPEYLIP
jgi:hypothetical protein